MTNYTTKSPHERHAISDRNTTPHEDVPHAIYMAARSISAQGQKSLEASKYYADAKVHRNHG